MPEFIRFSDLTSASDIQSLLNFFADYILKRGAEPINIVTETPEQISLLDQAYKIFREKSLFGSDVHLGFNILAQPPTPPGQPQKPSERYYCVYSIYTYKLRISPVDAKEIRRLIEFPPEYKQAGIGILNYFSDIIQKKYPNIDVGITIEQRGNRVTLIVNTPEGEKERIEQELVNYALAIQGKIQPEEYLSDPIEILALKNKLEMANLEIRQSRELMYTERRHYDKRIESLEKQVHLLGTLISQSQTSNAELMAAIREMSRGASSTTRKSLNVILEALERGISVEDKHEIMEALENIKKRDKPLFQKLYDLTVVGIYQGVAGNYFYDWLTALSRSLP